MRLAVVIGCLACASAVGQGLEFEVATIKPSPPGETGCVLRPAPGGEQYIAACLPLRPILWTAHWLKPNQVIGGPAWIDSDPYDIVGLAGRPSSIDDLHTMMQNLLADRFHLQFHRETKELPVYVLTVDKGGAKNLGRREIRNGSDLKIDQVTEGLNQKWTAESAPMNFFSWRLSQMMDRPVIDGTGLEGGYDFKLAFTNDPPFRGAAGKAPEPVDASGPNIFEALRDQLGLRLEAQRGPVEILVIDHVERPTAN
jgi:uncharacterized protein (TIGR03435 family)